MKKWIINEYYDFLMLLEDIIGSINHAIYKRRIKIARNYYKMYEETIKYSGPPL